MPRENSALDHYPDYECVIGIEVHVQLNTNTKIFCSCSHAVDQQPNTTICQICAGYPGTLPVLNKAVVESAIKAGLATKCTIAPISEFARKHYFYPDLPKGYQITQNDNPICTNGSVTIRLEDDTLKNIRLMRIHMEEDAGKNMHAGSSHESFVDLNRAGTPLLEIVTYPDIANAYEAKAYLKTLHTIIRYLGISTGNMEEGAFRADTNISVRKKGVQQYGTRVELKNINSFKFIGDAINHEIERHIELLESGQKIRQETRLWDTKNNKTVAMRSKEEAADYRYFPDPDLPLVCLSPDDIARVAQTMPELPEQKLQRLTAQGLSQYEADILVEDNALANYYEQAYKAHASKSIINWVLRDVLGFIKEAKITLHDCLVTPEKLAQLVQLVEKNVINNRVAQEVFALVAQTGQWPTDIVKEKGLEQIGSTDELESIVKAIVAAHPSVVADYKAGKERAFGFFVGEAMKQTKGKGNPKIIQELFKKYLQ